MAEATVEMAQTRPQPAPGEWTYEDYLKIYR